VVSVQCKKPHLSTLFMMLSVSAPFLTAQLRRLVTLSALFKEIPADPALGAAKTASNAEANTMLLPEKLLNRNSIMQKI
jgi:hypothetical protein